MDLSSVRMNPGMSLVSMCIWGSLSGLEQVPGRLLVGILRMKAVNPSLKAWAVRLKRCLLGMKPKAGEELVTCGLVTLRICHIPFLSHVEICHIHKLVTLI